MHEGDECFFSKTSWKKPISFSNRLVGPWSGRPVLTNGKYSKMNNFGEKGLCPLNGGTSLTGFKTGKTLVSF